MTKLSIITIFFIYLLHSSCKNRENIYTTTTFYTQDSLYKITFDKPLALDTFYSWKDEDDNGCSDEHKYRFSKKHFPHQREIGFFNRSFVDSTYRITLKHNEGYRCRPAKENEKYIETKNYLNFVYSKFKATDPKSNIDTLFQKHKIIKGRNFTLYAYRLKEDYQITNNYANGYFTEYLIAITIIDGNYLEFTADCRTKNNGDFIQRMEKSFETINIESIKHK